MVPSGPPPPPVGGNPTVSLSPASLPRTNSAILGGQGSGVAEGAIAPSQTAFPSHLSSRPHYGNLNMLGNLSNLSSIPGGGGNSGIGMNQGFNGGGNAATATSQTSASNSGISGTANIQRGRMTMGSDSLSIAGGAMGAFSSSSASMNLPGSSGSMVRLGGTSTTGQSQLQSQLQQHFANSNAQLSQDQQQQARHQQGQQMSHQQGQQQGQEMVSTLQQLQGQNILGGARGFQQFQGQNMLGLGASQQHQMQTLRGLTGDQGGQQQQLQSLRSLGSVKLDPQQLQSLRSSLAVKMEQQHGDQSILLQHQHQQQQQLLQLARQPSPQVQQLQAAQMNLLHQQRILQQQQLLQAFPQQRSLQQQPSQQLQQQNLQVTPPTKPQAYETGMCARLLMQYMFHQQQRPTDNSIDFWRKFVAKYFAPHAKKRWCVSLYGSGRQTTGVFPQDVWHCEICGTKPGRGFETTVEVLPRLCKIKYDSGTLEELLYVDMPREYQIHSGHYVLEYEKAIQESVFEQLRVVRDGQLRIVFSSDLKICSWEFCARSHEELIPRRLLIPQVSQLGVIAQKYQASIQNGTTNLSSQDLQTNCNMFVASARQLAKALEVPLVNDLGYTKRYVRCLQISEVVNSMKDLIDFSRENKIGPIESLNKFPRRTHSSSERQNQTIQTQEHQSGPETLSSEQSAGQASTMQPAPSNAVNNGNNSINTSSLASSTSTIAGLLHQNSMNSRQGSRLSVVTSSFASTVQVPSVGSSNSLQQSHASPGSSFPNSGSSVSNSVQVAAAVLPTTTVQLPQTSATANVLQQQPVQPAELDRSDSESSVQHIIQEMMMSSQRNGGGSLQQGVGGSNVGGNLGVNMGMSILGSDMKNLNGMVPTGSGSGAPKGANGLVGNCFSSNASVDANSLGGIPSMPGSANNMISMGNDIPMSNNTMTLNGRANMTSITQNLTIQDPNFNLQQDFGGNRLLNGFNSVGSFNNMQFDWKSP